MAINVGDIVKLKDDYDLLSSWGLELEMQRFPDREYEVLSLYGRWHTGLTKTKMFALDDNDDLEYPEEVLINIGEL